MTETAATPAKRENIWLNLGLNVFVPSLIMTQLSGVIDPKVVLVIALAFPVCYFIYDFIYRSKYNFFSILGFVSILISGGVGLLGIDKDWIAIKEAAIPALFAVAVIISLRSPFPLVRTFLYTPEIFDVQKIQTALENRNNEKPFDRLMTKCTLFLAGSFVISAVLNFALAKYFIRSESGTDEFVKEMGRMTFWSYPVILVPSVAVMLFALWQLIKGIESYTGYEWEEVLVLGHHSQDASTVAKDVVVEPTADEQKS